MLYTLSIVHFRSPIFPDASDGGDGVRASGAPLWAGRAELANRCSGDRGEIRGGRRRERRYSHRRRNLSGVRDVRDASLRFIFSILFDDPRRERDDLRRC